LEESPKAWLREGRGEGGGGGKKRGGGGGGDMVMQGCLD